MNKQIAREISYAHSARTRGGRTLIRVVENTTGRLKLIRKARGYDDEVRRGRDFWEVITERYGLSLEVTGGSLDNIPGSGPLIVVSNHPYGILDGLMMGHILNRTRGDFRILAHRVFRKSPDLARVILPINFDDTRDAVQENLATRRVAMAYLKQGGAIGIFPGGTVSTAARPFGQPIDPGWRNFTARMVAKSGATVVPVFFEGANSRLFNLASHLHQNLRVALLIKEFRKRLGTPVRVVVGEPVAPQAIAARAGDACALMDFLRAETYALSHQPFKTLEYGYEFEEKYRT